MSPLREPDACQWADSVGAHLLDALPPEEERDFSRHLADCALCREDVTRLRTAVAALAHAPRPVAAPASLRRRIMPQVQRESAAHRHAQQSASGRRHPGLLVSLRTAVVAGSATALAAAAVAVVIALGAGGHVAGRPLSPRLLGQVSVRVPGGSGRLLVSGQEATLRVSGLPEPPRGRIYQVWVQRGPGHAPEATDALFSTRAGGTADVEVPGPLTGVRRVLVTNEPRGGSVVPTRQPIIVATL